MIVAWGLMAGSQQPLATQQRFSPVHPPKGHKLQRWWNHGAYPLRAAVLAELPLNKYAISAGMSLFPTGYFGGRSCLSGKAEFVNLLGKCGVLIVR